MILKLESGGMLLSHKKQSSAFLLVVFIPRQRRSSSVCVFFDRIPRQVESQRRGGSESRWSQYLLT